MHMRMHMHKTIGFQPERISSPPLLRTHPWLNRKRFLSSADSTSILLYILSPESQVSCLRSYTCSGMPRVPNTPSMLSPLIPLNLKNWRTLRNEGPVTHVWVGPFQSMAILPEGTNSRQK